MFLVLATFALVGLALPTGGAVAFLPPAAVVEEEEEDFLAEIFDFAIDLLDLDLDGTEDTGDGGDGTEDGANVSQQDSTQERNNRNVDSQGNVQRQSRQIVTDGGSGEPQNP